jgi:hypothetical protein
MTQEYSSERSDPSHSICEASLRLESDGSEMCIVTGTSVEARFPAVSGEPAEHGSFDAPDLQPWCPAHTSQCSEKRARRKPLDESKRAAARSVYGAR